MTGTALDPILAFLIPLFLKVAGGDTAQARQAAVQLLDCYGATTEAERILAAEIIAFSFATLDDLSRSVADPDMAISTRLRLRSNANALSRASDRNRQALAKAKKVAPEPAKQATQPPSTTPPEVPNAMQNIRDAIIGVVPGLAANFTSDTPVLSRDQRRYLSRKAEEARAARDREARQAARRAERAIARGITDSGLPQSNTP